ncbi:MAG TPA: vanadium-dependent haloperoxidase [Flavisolibacter sp.]|jgi:hypothetical protein|nr:vanadium-dependent haloperoxidase [Flavisolibacter sp.]
MNKSLTAILIFITTWGCRQQAQKGASFSSDAIRKVVTKMTEIMVHDVTNPPLASRFFSYACLAGYEVIAQNDTSCRSLHLVLNNYPQIKKPDSVQGYSYQLAALLAIMETAKKMQPSGKLFEAFEKNFLDSCKKSGFSEEEITASKRYALNISSQILLYAKADGYNRISNYARYTPLRDEGFWYPTPPAYIAAIEPYFKTIRPFTLDSCTQFKPPPPAPFSEDKASVFYKLMLRNYKEPLTEEHRLIAAYWDCNPFAVEDKGHLLVGLKKISPGAHWLGITGAACTKGGKNFSEAMQIYATVAIGLMDGFICCWDEKYRSNRIRPETAIRKCIDPDWTPLLQTPPFPEYLSGHSTISSGSATILTHFFGDNFHFTDSTEMPYGLAPRSFTSFHQAAKEAAISRFYGGIHFIDAIDNGFNQGEKVGEWVLKKAGSTIPRKDLVRKNN